MAGDFDSPSQFYAHWLARAESVTALTDDQIADILRYRESDTAVAVLVGALACRGKLTVKQTAKLLAELPERFSDDDHAYRHVLALVILRDGLRTPLSKLDQMLNLSCDWAAALAIVELGPYSCGQAFDLINRSSRPPRVKSELCATTAAHQKALWAEIKGL